ncbi:multidrug effflux MFS transporter [Vibrio crassostreae]|uniref:multidrug effflux MFS transporter n=1 Tax=Vibrio crassostreae TaxID=246167 RepID=UPI000F4E53D2|nr:multidrug effflux MFS transporter [Vibrio crassostreae]RPF02418.1 Bcr/CflA subfamily drug resistance transporter [Vibrio crassostreae]TCT75098.1 Bcr/CflA subfamily drug resistance transporter [Vibrio crassostreae]CAK2509627.1 MFS transporter, DHA1 family, 2-module integral membrane pump EmrD [Vibrio crassostreae]CAK3080996.1 MFS transporter, DHA1 family, 2-module integral membrane pump EmrD [Vibrio crassostreae]
MIQSTFKKTPLLLAMMIIATGQVGVSIYLPSLPLIAADLSVTQVDVQLLVTLFLVGFGLSQLFYGPMSDAVGRRPIFLLGQGVYLIGTVVCVVFSDSMLALEVGRLLQGLGAGSASVLGRSVLRDSYDGPQLTKALSYISITASIMPIIAPVFGGWISFHLGWQAVFLFVLMYLLAIFTLGYFVLHETLPYGKSRFDACQVVKNYGRLLTNRQVLTSASYNWMSYMASLVSLSLFPFLMQEQLGLTAAEYGSLMIVPSAGLLIGSVALNLLNRRFSTSQLMSLAILIILASGTWLLTHELSIFNLVWAFTWLAIAQGISFPLSISMLLEPHKKQAGAVSALSGSIQMCLAGLLGGYLVESWVTTHLQLGVFYLIIGAAMGGVLWSSTKMNKKGDTVEMKYS